MRKLLSTVMRFACERLAKHLPLRVIGRADDTYLERYYLCGKAPPYPISFTKWPHERIGFLPTVYLHRFVRSDEDKELHNHPFAGTAFILAGGYSEERRFACADAAFMAWPWMPASTKREDVGNPETGFWVLRRTFRPGQVNRLEPETYHRVDLLEKDAWTIFTIGPKVQSWGFWSRFTGEFIHWKDHMLRNELRRRATSQTPFQA